MGGCFSCCCCCCGSKGDGSRGGGGGTSKETEMAVKKSLAISVAMSSPNIVIGDRTEISGHGMAVVGVAIEQDAAYWEWRIELPAKVHVDTLMFGVTGKKNRKFYQELENKIQQEEGVTSQVNGTTWMRRVEVQNNDVVGVAVQQSDLPMVQFFLNGEPLYESAVNRFRGTVYPSICLPESAKETLNVSLVLDENEWKYPTPAQRFLPLIVARSIV